MLKKRINDLNFELKNKKKDLNQRNNIQATNVQDLSDKSLEDILS